MSDSKINKAVLHSWWGDLEGRKAFLALLSLKRSELLESLTGVNPSNAVSIADTQARIAVLDWIGSKEFTDAIIDGKEKQ